MNVTAEKTIVLRLTEREAGMILFLTKCIGGRLDSPGGGIEGAVERVAALLARRIGGEA